jgi:hypothetical protein
MKNYPIPFLATVNGLWSFISNTRKVEWRVFAGGYHFSASGAGYPGKFGWASWFKESGQLDKDMIPAIPGHAKRRPLGGTCGRTSIGPSSPSR